MIELNYIKEYISIHTSQRFPKCVVDVEPSTRLTQTASVCVRRSAVITGEDCAETEVRTITAHSFHSNRKDFTSNIRVCVYA